MDLAEHTWNHPWSRVAIVFPWLFWVALRHEHGRNRAESKSRRLIWACILVGLAIELLAVSGDVLRLGRVGFCIAAVGMVCGAGWARWQAALLLVWMIPLPNSLNRMLSPGLESLWGSIGAVLAPGVVFESGSLNMILVAGETNLKLVPADGGLAVFFGLAGLGWFRSIISDEPGLNGAGRAMRWGMLMIPIQLAILTIGSLMLSSGSAARSTRWVMDQAGWILILAFGLTLSLRAMRASARDERSRRATS